MSFRIRFRRVSTPLAFVLTLACPALHAQTAADPGTGLAGCASIEALNAKQAALRSAGPVAPDPTPSKPELRTELLAMRDRDVDARNAAAASAREKGGRPDNELVLQIFATDHENLIRYKEIIDGSGFPTVAQVGRDGVAAAFLLAQHADSDRALQAKVLKQAQPLAAKGEIASQDLAQLTDRVRIGEGRPQVYGSQFRAVEGINHPQPIEDAAKVDSRRAKAGLLPLRDYGCIMQQAYGFPVDLVPHSKIISR